MSKSENNSSLDEIDVVLQGAHNPYELDVLKLHDYRFLPTMANCHACAKACSVSLSLA